MQIAKITLPDANDLQVDFNPLIKDGLVISYADTTPLTLGLQQDLSLGMRSPKKDVNRKVTVKLTVPYGVEAVDGSTTYNAVSAFVDFVIPADAPKSKTEDLLSFLAGACANAQIVDTTVNGAFPY